MIPASPTLDHPGRLSGGTYDTDVATNVPAIEWQSPRSWYMSLPSLHIRWIWREPAQTTMSPAPAGSVAEIKGVWGQRNRNREARRSKLTA